MFPTNMRVINDITICTISRYARSVWRLQPFTIIYFSKMKSKQGSGIIFTVSSGINLAPTFDSDEISKYLPIAAINRSIVWDDAA